MEIKPYIRKANYYETDQMGIIHHSNYIRWFEEARIDWLEQVGISFQSMEDEGVGNAVTYAGCEYKSMVRFGEVVAIELRLTLLTGAKMYVEYTVRDAASGDIRATGETRHGFVNAEGRPVSVKRSGPRFYEVLSQYAEATAKKRL